MSSVEMVELWRGAFRESVHRGHAVVCDASGEVRQSWGEPDKIVLPRSSAKMVQALPLVESGAARRFGLGSEQLALACASHTGAAIHTERVTDWLATLELDESALLCGPQTPEDRDARKHLLCSDVKACQIHNNCSGKHTGFLTLTKHLNAGADYISPAHPVQQAVRNVWEELTGETSPGFGIDGCSAPNFAASLTGLARAMAGFAAAREGHGTRATAQAQLVNAMRSHPDLVAGERRACTGLMRAMAGRVVVKTGAEGVFIAILPEQKLGVAVKIEDGTTRASQCAIAAILVGLGALDPDHAAARTFMTPRLLSRSGTDTGRMRPVPGLFY